MPSRLCPAEIAPDIVVLSPGAGYWDDAARHLLTSLGLPQVMLARQGEPLPRTVHSVVLFGPESWSPTVDRAERWRLVRGGPPRSSFRCLDRSEIRLPAQRILTIAADGRDRMPAEIGRLEQTLFWLRERLAKGTGPLSSRDASEWQITLELLGLKPGRDDRLHELLTRLLAERGSQEIQDSPARLHCRILAGWWRRALAVLRRTDRIDRHQALARPDLLVRAAQQRDRESASQLRDLLRTILPACRSSHRLTAVGIAAALLGEQEILQAVRTTLARPEWNRPGVAFPRSTENGTGFCYSPLVAAWLYLEAKAALPAVELPAGFAAVRQITQPLTWLTVAGGELVDSASRAISLSLLENWLLLHGAPCPEGTQLKIEAQCYRPDIALLESAWIDVFRRIQHAKRRPLLRLRPWPHGCQAALSLRYDVDRPVDARRIAEVVAIQHRTAGVAFGSWYYFARDPQRTSQASQLASLGQEIGIHAETPADAAAGLGVTHHSAPTSEYWRGDSTMIAIDRAGASYGEFLAHQVFVPRPAWLPNHAGRLGRTWITPLYFPLEGSTRDRGLAYFDRLLLQFRDLLRRGGHAIIGSHPDLDQSGLPELLQRENLPALWMAPVGTVVERCRHVLTPGNIVFTTTVPDGAPALLAERDITDLNVEIFQPESPDPFQVALQLVAGRPSRVPGLEPVAAGAGGS